MRVPKVFDRVRLFLHTPSPDNPPTGRSHFVPKVMLPIDWLTAINDSRPLLGYLLTAQAAIAALTLAVSIFVMQGARTQKDIDDRMYREYIRQSWVSQCFWIGLVAVAFTGAVPMVQSLVGIGNSAENTNHVLRILILLAPLAFVTNPASAGALFLRSIELSNPGS